MITWGLLRHFCSQCNQDRRRTPHFLRSPLDLSSDLQSQLEPLAWTEASTLLAMLPSVLVLLRSGESAHCLFAFIVHKVSLRANQENITEKARDEWWTPHCIKSARSLHPAPPGTQGQSCTTSPPSLHGCGVRFDYPHRYQSSRSTCFNNSHKTIQSSLKPCHGICFNDPLR